MICPRCGEPATRQDKILQYAPRIRQWFLFIHARNNDLPVLRGMRMIKKNIKRSCYVGDYCPYPRQSR